MKNLITILTVSILTISTAFATTTPEVEMISVDNLEVFEAADYNAESETLDFTTKSDISMIQIFDLKGEMVFQLPVMSNYVQLNKNLFDSGSHKLGFIMQGNNEIHFTHVTIK